MRTEVVQHLILTDTVGLPSHDDSWFGYTDEVMQSWMNVSSFRTVETGFLQLMIFEPSKLRQQLSYHIPIS